MVVEDKITKEVTLKAFESNSKPERGGYHLNGTISEKTFRNMPPEERDWLIFNTLSERCPARLIACGIRFRRIEKAVIVLIAMVLIGAAGADKVIGFIKFIL